MIEANGSKRTERVVKGWVNNLAEPVFSSDTNVLKAVEAGNCSLTIVNTYYLARLIESNSVENLGIFWANQEDRGVHVNISGQALLNGLTTRVLQLNCLSGCRQIQLRRCMLKQIKNIQLLMEFLFIL